MSSFAEIFSVKNVFGVNYQLFFVFVGTYQQGSLVSVVSLLYFLEIESNGLLFILIQRLD